jgi:hypothetical protein
MAIEEKLWPRIAVGSMYLLKKMLLKIRAKITISERSGCNDLKLT